MLFKIISQKWNACIREHMHLTIWYPQTFPTVIEMVFLSPLTYSLHGYTHTHTCSMRSPCGHMKRPDAPALPQPNIQPVTFRGTQFKARGKGGEALFTPLMRVIGHHDLLSGALCRKDQRWQITFQVPNYQTQQSSS